MLRCWNTDRGEVEKRRKKGKKITVVKLTCLHICIAKYCVKTHVLILEGCALVGPVAALLTWLLSCWCESNVDSCWPNYPCWKAYVCVPIRVELGKQPYGQCTGKAREVIHCDLEFIRKHTMFFASLSHTWSPRTHLNTSFEGRTLQTHPVPCTPNPKIILDHVAFDSKLRHKRLNYNAHQGWEIYHLLFYSLWINQAFKLGRSLDLFAGCEVLLYLFCFFSVTGCFILWKTKMLWFDVTWSNCIFLFLIWLPVSQC